MVTGTNTSALCRIPLDATTLENPHPQRGMISSVHTGIHGLAPEAEAFFIHPVDIPLVPPSVLQRLLVAAILAYNGNGGLRVILQRHTISEVACREPGILWDMDTPEDYQRLLHRAITVQPCITLYNRSLTT